MDNEADRLRSKSMHRIEGQSMSRHLVWLGWLWVMLLFALATLPQERTLRAGTIVRLELAPVDPRSLMQGDYMALNYAITRNIPRNRDHSDDGYVMVKPDENRVARFVRIDDTGQAREAGELALKFRVRKGEVRFATNAFFFQEGHAQRYEPARYGEFRVDARGNPLLTGLLDSGLRPLGEMRR